MNFPGVKSEFLPPSRLVLKRYHRADGLMAPDSEGTTDPRWFDGWNLGFKKTWGHFYLGRMMNTN